MNRSGIYKIQSKSKPERIYIGSAANLHRRKLRHFNYLRKNKHHSRLMQRHFNKYGEDDLVFSVLLLCEKEDLIKSEQFYIDSYKTYFNTFMEAGTMNRLGIKHSEETKRKIALNTKSNTPEARLRMSLQRKGKKLSEEHKQKLRGIPKSEEFKKMQSIRMKERKRAPFTEEAKRKSSASHKKPILQFDMQMNLIKEWDGAKDARLVLFPNTKNSGITACIKGRKRSYKGFIWRHKQIN